MLTADEKLDALTDPDTPLSEAASLIIGAFLEASGMQEVIVEFGYATDAKFVAGHIGAFHENGRWGLMTHDDPTVGLNVLYDAAHAILTREDPFGIACWILDGEGNRTVGYQWFVVNKILSGIKSAEIPDLIKGAEAGVVWGDSPTMASTILTPEVTDGAP